MEPLYQYNQKDTKYYLWERVWKCFREITVVGESVGSYIEEKYKTDFEIAHKNSKIQNNLKDIETN